MKLKKLLVDGNMKKGKDRQWRDRRKKSVETKECG